MADTEYYGRLDGTGGLYMRRGAAAFAALAEPTRLAMVRLLLDHK